MPDPGDTAKGDRGQGTSSSSGLKGGSGGNKTGVGGGGGGGGGSTGSRGSSTGNVGSGNGSNAPGNAGAGQGGQRGAGSNYGAGSGRPGTSSGAGGVGTGAGGQRGAGSNYGAGSGRPGTGVGGQGVAGGKTDLGGNIAGGRTDFGGNIAGGRGDFGGGIALGKTDFGGSSALGKGDKPGNTSGVGGPGAGGMGAQNVRNGSSTSPVGPSSGYSAPGNIGSGIDAMTGQISAGIDRSRAAINDGIEGINTSIKSSWARNPGPEQPRGMTPSQMAAQYSQYRAPPGATPNDVSRLAQRDIEAVRGLNSINTPRTRGLSPSPSPQPTSTSDLYGTPSGFMSPEVKRETQYGYDTLYSPNDLNNLYKGINAYGIGDMERRIAAQQSLLGQTIDVSQYGGRVTANLNNNISVPRGSARTVDPFNDNVITHWTGSPPNKPEDLSKIRGYGYATTIDNMGNVNYTRAFNADGTMPNTNHTKGLNTGNFGIVSQGIEPNEQQLKAAAALGGNWFNPNASVSTHGYEAGTRVKMGDRPFSEVGKKGARPDREGVALASAFTGQDDVGATWTRTTLSEDRPVTMASGLGQSYRNTAMSNNMRDTSSRQTPASVDLSGGMEYPGGDGITSADIGGWGEDDFDTIYDGPVGPSRPSPNTGNYPSRGSQGPWGNLDEGYGPRSDTGFSPSRGDINLGQISQDAGVSPGTYAMTNGEGFNPTGSYVDQNPSQQRYDEAFNDIFGPGNTVPSWRQSTYTGRPVSSPTEVDIFGGTDYYDPLGSIKAPTTPNQDSLHVVGGAGFAPINTPRGTSGPNFDAARYSPEDRDILYGGGPMTPADDPERIGDIETVPEPSYIDPITQMPPEHLPETPRAWKMAEKLPFGIGLGARMLRTLGGLEWDRLTEEERANLMQKWATENKAYLSNGNLGGSKQEPLQPSGLYGDGNNAYVPIGAGDPPPDDKPEDPNDPNDPWGGRTRVGNPADPYNYGYGPGFNYFTYA